MPPPGEPGPNLESFGGDSLNPAWTGGAAAGGIIGTNHLQTAIDRLTRAVDTFEGTVKKLSGFTQQLPGGSGGMLGGMAKPGAMGQDQSSPGTFITNGGFPAPCSYPSKPGGAAPQVGWGTLPNGGNQQPFPTVGQTSPVPQYGGVPPMVGTPAFPSMQPGPISAGPPMGAGGQAQSPISAGPRLGGGNGGGYVISAGPILGQQGQQQGPTSSYPPPLGAGAVLGGMSQQQQSRFPGSTVPPTSPPAQQSPNGSSSGGGPMGIKVPTLSGSIAGILSGIASAGANNMGGQLALNTYQYQGQLAMNSGSYAANQAALGKQAYGSAGNLTGAPQLQNIFGTSPTDLAQAYSTMISNAGNPMLNQTQIGRSLLSGTAQFGYLNPAMSGTQAAQAMSSLYTPQSSLKQRMLGYPVTPLTAGKPGAAGFGQWMAGQFQAWGLGPGRNLSPSQMAAQLGPRGILYQNLQAEGLNPSQYAAPIEAYNRLFQGLGSGPKGSHPPLGAQQAQALMGQLSSQNPDIQKKAEARLQNYGIDQTDLNRLKGVAGTKAAQQQDTSRGFTAGLQAATRSLQDFNTAMGKVLNTLHANTPLGFGQGFGGTMKSMGNLAALGGGLGLGMGLVKGLFGKSAGSVLSRGMGSAFSKIFGGGGGAGGGGAADAAGSTAAGGAGADAAGGAAAAGGGGTAAALGGGALAAGAGLAAAAASTGHYRHKPKNMSWEAYLRALIREGEISPHVLAKFARDPQGVEQQMNADAAPGIQTFGGANKRGGGAKSGGGSPSMDNSPVIVSSSGAIVPPGNAKHSMPGSATKQAQLAVKLAESQEGVPYVYGEEKPGKGFDCSGLTQWAYKRAGVSLPRTAKQQWEFLRNRKINMNDLQTGDLVFGRGPNGEIDHVAMMVSGTHLIEAPNTGGSVSIYPYRRGQWLFGARPTGNMKNAKSSTNAGATANTKNPVRGGAKSKKGGSGGGGGGGGGYQNPLRGIHGLRPERIDMGVDYSGSGPIYALGPGVITNTSNSGWPGGAFISERLTGGPYAGHYWYEAENISPSVHVGQQVTANTVVGQVHGSIEVGWAAPGGKGATMAQQFHQQNPSGDPGGRESAFGQLASQLLKSLGAPGGLGQGKVFGSIPKGWASAASANAGSNSGTGSGGGGASVGPVLTPHGGGGAGAGADLGAGDTPSEGSTSELAAFGSAISGGGGAGSGYYGNSIQVMGVTNNPSNSGGNAKGSIPAGSGGTGIAALARYLKSAGYSKPAAAGMAGVAGGEGTGANPEVVGSGGAGLIGWTPPSTMVSVGGTCHAAGIGHLSTAQDMANQEKAMVKWASKFGFPPPQNRFPNSLAGAMQAARAASAAYEKPAVPGSDVHANLIQQAWSALATGGPARAGSLALVGERGPELVKFNQDANVFTAKQTAQMMKAGSAEAPFMRPSDYGDMKFSTAHPVYSGTTGGKAAPGGKQVSLTFNSGSIVIQMPPAMGTSLPMGSSARVMAKMFVEELAKMNVYDTIASGDNC